MSDNDAEAHPMADISFSEDNEATFEWIYLSEDIYFNTDGSSTHNPIVNVRSGVI